MLTTAFVVALIIAAAYALWRFWQPKIDLTNLDAPPVRRRLVGLGGYAGAGKDTAALGLIRRGWVRVSVADKLRDSLYALNPLVPITTTDDGLTPWPGTQYVRLSGLVDQVGWERAKNEHPEVRQLLQRLGVEVLRDQFGENVLVDAVLRDLPDADVVVTDTRFPNELAAIRDRDGDTIWIDRPGVGPVNGHSTDNSLSADDFDAVVVNDSDAVTLQHRLAVEVDYF